MKKLIKAFTLFLMIITAALMSVVVYGYLTVPENIYTVTDEKPSFSYPFTYSIEEKTASKSIITEGEYSLKVKLFDKIPVKNSSLKVSQRRYVVPSGEIIGLRLFTKGVMVVGIDSVDSSTGGQNPAKAAGLQKGDVILKINGKEVISSTEVDTLVAESGGAALEVEYCRGGKNFTCNLVPVYSVSAKRYKTGLWVRDSAAGIGTMTYYEPSTGYFAGLGHAVCDIDTGEILPLSNGDIVDAEILRCVRGKSGTAGELCGSFKSDSEGILISNCESGIFGYLYEYPKNEKALPIATESEVVTGEAQIISTIEGDEPEYYTVEIEKLSFDNKEGKNMTVKITDPVLLEKTGGIVQGMSGSPIIQNGRLIGAVTHVLLNDPTRGYGILAENMKVD